MTWLASAIWSVTALFLKHVSYDFRSDLVYTCGTFLASLSCSASLVLNFFPVFSCRFQLNNRCMGSHTWHQRYSPFPLCLWDGIRLSEACNVMWLHRYWYAMFFFINLPQLRFSDKPIFAYRPTVWDPDQTAPRGAVWSGFTLFAKMTFKITSRWQSWQQLLWLAV